MRQPRASRRATAIAVSMNFDDALKHYSPRVWFRFKFLKYKFLKRGEPELWLIRHLVEPGTTALDVGASIGIYAAEMARYAGKVIAFEANPEVAAFARSVAARNVEVVNMALSSRAGRTTLTVPLNARGRAVTELASIAPKQQSERNAVTVDVETRRLDDFSVSNCGFIKIDVEGHEEAVLDGASALIAAQRPVLMIELDEDVQSTASCSVSRRATRRWTTARLFLSQRQTASDRCSSIRHVHQNAANLKPRHKLPPGREYINNFAVRSGGILGTSPGIASPDFGSTR